MDRSEFQRQSSPNQPFLATFFGVNFNTLAQKPARPACFTPHLALIAFLVCAQSMHAGQWFSGKAHAEGDALYQSAFAAYDGGDYTRAQTLLDQAEKLKPNQADGWNLRGAVYLKQGIYTKAEAAFKRASTLDPKLWAAQFNYAESAFQGKNYPTARSRFDYLATQTDRFKQKNQWELAQYKAFLSSLLMNDEAGAQKRQARLPQAGGVTPAYAYAQAAVAYHRKDMAAAQKSLALAQASYSPALNGLFTDSLVTVGWQTPALSPNMGLVAAETMLPGTRQQPAFVIDPKIEAAAAEPLPATDPVNHAPVITRVVNPPINASPSDALLQPSVAVKHSTTPSPLDADSALERGTLLD